MTASHPAPPVTPSCDGRGLVGVACPESLPARAAWVVPDKDDFVALDGPGRYRWAVVVRCPRALQHAFTFRFPPVGSVLRVEQGRMHVHHSGPTSALESPRAGVAR